MARVAVIQRPPVWLDREATLRAAVTSCSPTSISSASLPRRSLDVAGHYARPDVFHLQVNDRPQRAVTFTASSDCHD